MSTVDSGSTDRAVAALYGLAIGDALGMPTQLLSRQQVAARYGTLNTFHAAVDDHPIAGGLPAGSITDDTEQALLLAEVLMEGDGHVDPELFAHRLMAWQQRMQARGSLDLLGPSTHRAVTAMVAGSPATMTGRTGSTNGAAMRITPVGLLMPAGDLPALVDRVEEASLVSHHTGIAIAGASAVAAAVSTGVAGGTLQDSWAAAVAAAELGAGRGHWVAGASVARRISWALELADPAEPDRSLRDLDELVGTSLATQESVPTAFGVLASHPDDPWAAVLAAASLGGDSDTIAAMVGAVAGACCGLAGFPQSARRLVAEVNDLHLEQVAAALLALRRR